MSIAVQFNLSGLVALVDGANSGIGRAIEGALAEARARVVLVVRRAKELAEAQREIGECAAALPCDLTDRRALGECAVILRRASVEGASGAAVYDPREAGGPAANSMDLVVDAVGGKITHAAALAAVKPGRVFMHLGLQDGVTQIDVRELTLAEITLIGTYTRTSADLLLHPSC